MASTFNKFYYFTEDLAKGLHDLSTHSLRVALTNTRPNATTCHIVGNITGSIAVNTFKATSSFAAVASACAQTNGTLKLVLRDRVLIASSSTSTAAFQYIVLYNAANSNKNTIGFYDYGSSIVLQRNETFTIDFDSANGVLTIA